MQICCFQQKIGENLQDADFIEGTLDITLKFNP